MKMNPFDLSGRVAVVTGANTGIGQAIAIALAQAGADVALVGRTPAEDTAAAIRDLGRRALIVSADLSSIEPVQRIVDETVAGLGGLDIWSTMPASSAAPMRSTSPKRIGTRWSTPI